MPDDLSELTPYLGIAVGVSLFALSIVAISGGEPLIACYLVGCACFLMLLLAMVQVEED